ncbi:protein translocase subunit SecF [Nocardia higoensis]|uniref:Protein-export membrane protein SecF n=1 Tax=Nocardia higoensis TaxID=228599 RepID=A0ABS0D8I6_9NOCA|nr:protein translocase subunit SecF [Nocardia higoensis]MBF6354425.1 protein translocase subunit SecF [Nocardia higoensis]
MTNPNGMNNPSLNKRDEDRAHSSIDDFAYGSGEPRHGFFNRLYTGTGAIDVIGRRRMWYTVTAVIVLLALASMLIRGFNFGIDFEGGSRIQFPAGDATTSQVEEVYRDTLGSDPETVQTVGTGSTATVLIRSEALDARQVDQLTSALYEEFQPKNSDGEPSRSAISVSDVSETWGDQITEKALLALAVFLLLVSVYIAIRFERDMAIAALAAMFFDVVVTAGIYSLVGFEVSPATVIGILTILGFSLYDSVVVFDKVEENTRGILHLNRRTYAEQANLAVNQTLMRSINTAVIGVLPIAALMVIAVWMLGVGTLKDLALVQLVGLLVGTYSSIFFASPLLVSLKERWGPVAAHTKKVLAKRSNAAAARAAREAELRVASATRRTGGEDFAAAGPRPGARSRGGEGRAAGEQRPSGKRQRRN